MPMSKTKELFGTFFKIGAFTFGGGYAMVALLEFVVLWSVIYMVIKLVRKKLEKDKPYK